jgi:hypothetical protein
MTANSFHWPNIGLGAISQKPASPGVGLLAFRGIAPWHHRSGAGHIQLNRLGERAFDPAVAFASDIDVIRKAVLADGF